MLEAGTRGGPEVALTAAYMLPLLPLLVPWWCHAARRLGTGCMMAARGKPDRRIAMAKSPRGSGSSEGPSKYGQATPLLPAVCAVCLTSPRSGLRLS